MGFIQFNVINGILYFEVTFTEFINFPGMVCI